MSLVIDFRMGEDALKTLLKENENASRLTLKFQSEGQCSVLMHSREKIVKMMGEITKNLKHITHVLFDHSDSVHCDAWFVHCNFPVEALGTLLEHHADTLVSVTTSGQDAMKIDGSPAEMKRTMVALGNASKMVELDLSWLIFVVVPEIHTSDLPEEQAVDYYGYIIDPNGDHLDVTQFLDSIQRLSSLETLAFCFNGCEFETECYILQEIISSAKALKSVELRFHARRRDEAALSEEKVGARLNSTLKAALPSDTKLEKLMMKSGYGGYTKYGYGSKVVLDDDAIKALRSSSSMDPPKNKEAKTASTTLE